MYMYTYIISYEHILIIPIGVYRLVNYTIYLVLTQSFLRKSNCYYICTYCILPILVEQILWLNTLGDCYNERSDKLY